MTNVASDVRAFVTTRCSPLRRAPLLTTSIWCTKLTDDERGRQRLDVDPAAEDGDDFGVAVRRQARLRARHV